MFSQEDIDATLKDAEQAVDTLVEDVNGLSGKTQQGDDAEAQHPPPVPRSAPVESSPNPQKPAAAPVQRLLKLKVPVVVRLAERQMPVAEIMKLVPGTILEFDRRVDSELDLLVNTHQIGAGVAVKVEERFGIRVTYIGDIKERINSLAG